MDVSLQSLVTATMKSFVPLDIDVVDLHVLRFQLIDDGTVEIVNEQDAELQEEGLDITEQILTANPDVQTAH